MGTRLCQTMKFLSLYTTDLGTRSSCHPIHDNTGNVLLILGSGIITGTVSQMNDVIVVSTTFMLTCIQPGL